MSEIIISYLISNTIFLFFVVLFCGFSVMSEGFSAS